MKRTSIQLLVLAGLLCTSFIYQSQAADACGNYLSEWTQKAACPSHHREGAAQALNGKLYIFSGFYTNDLEATNRLDIYDPVTDKWTVGAVMPAVGNVTHCQSASWVRSSANPQPEGVGRYIFIAGGFLNKNPGAIYNQVWRYDVVANTWTKLPDLPSDRASGGVAIDSEDKLHYLSGLVNRTTESGVHWTLNLRNTAEGWVESVAMPIPRNHFPAIPFGDTIYTPGGVIGHDVDPVDQNVFHRFNIKTKAWEKLADLPFPRSHAEASTMFINNRLVQFGGRNKNPGYPGVLGTVAEYDIPSNTWQYLRSMPYNSTTPTVGFFPNITVGGQQGDYVVLTVGGLDWNNGRKNTYIARVTWNCSTPIPPGPTYAPESTATATATATATSSEASSTVSDNTENSQTDVSSSDTVDSNVNSSSSSEESSTVEQSSQTSQSSTSEPVPSEEEEGSASIAHISIYCLIVLVGIVFVL